MADNTDIVWVINDLTSVRVQNYRLYQQYYDGDHRLLFATDKYLNAFGNLFQAFADNLCPTVVDSAVDRLKVVNRKGNTNEISQAIDDIWDENCLDRQQLEVYQNAGTQGDAFIIVWPEADEGPSFYVQNATEVTVRYKKDDPDDIELGAKLWKEPKKSKADPTYYRLNLYYTDRIEKYQAKEGEDKKIPTDLNKWAVYVEEGEDAQSLVNRWGVVPVFPFSTGAAAGKFGRSDLQDIVPLQDALNKSIADMLVAMEFAAYPQRYATGIQVDSERDANGNPTGRPATKPPFRSGADRLWAVRSTEASFGQFQSADLSKFIEVSNSFRQEIAAVSGTPLHYVKPDGTAPSGEALKTSEARLVKKAEKRSINYGETWERALELAYKMKQNNPNTQVEVEITWDSFATRDELILAQSLQIQVQVFGLSQEEALRQMGYSQDQIDDMKEENQVTQNSMASAMLTAFERSAPVSPAQGNNLNGGSNPVEETPQTAPAPVG